MAIAIILTPGPIKCQTARRFEQQDQAISVNQGSHDNDIVLTTRDRLFTLILSVRPGTLQFQPPLFLFNCKLSV